jgi:HlyD family secretion protein
MKWEGEVKRKGERILSVGIKAALCVLLAVVIVGGCGGSPVSVTIERVSPRAISETVMIAGNLSPATPAQVMPLVNGVVQTVYVQEGQQVTAGQPILQLDTSQLTQQLLSAQGSLESTQSLSGMINSLASSASNLGSSLSGAVNSALSSVDAGVTSLISLEKLIVPVLPEDQRMAALQVIDASYQSYANRRQNVPSISTGGGSGGFSNGAQVAAADQAIKNAQKNLQAATILSPANGTVIAASSGGASINSLMSTLMSSFSGMIPSGLNLSSLSGLSGGLTNVGMPSSGQLVAGSFVSPGSPIFTIVDLKNMDMVSKVDESDIAKISAGQPAEVSLEAYPGKKFGAKVVKISDTATTNEAGATAFDVTVQMDPADRNLKVGMTGTADVTVAEKTAATTVPVDAIVEKKGTKYVYRVVDGKAKLTPVEVGIVTDSEVEILDGVKIGDQVVTKGVEKLKDGQAVKEAQPGS